MELLLETSELKTNCAIDLQSKSNLKIKVFWKQPQYAVLLNKVSIFSVILLYLAKYFCKHELPLKYIIADSNGPSQGHLSWPANDGRNGRAYKKYV